MFSAETQLKENSQPGPPPRRGTSHPAFAIAISNTATEFDAALYDFRSGPLCSGYFRDAETGLDYSVNRYHQPGMGRFLTPDPYMAKSTGAAEPRNPGSWNRYSYANDDPINAYDPSGLLAICPAGSYSTGFLCVFSVTYTALGLPPDMQASSPPVASGTSQQLGVLSYMTAASTAKQSMPAALAAAIDAVNNNPDCAALFGTAQTRSSGFDPASALQTLYGNVGTLFPTATFLGGTPVSSGFVPGWTLPSNAAAAEYAVLVAGVNNGLPYAGWGLSVGINPSVWNSINTTGQAVLLLHEMGHIYANISGSGGSQIANDAGDSATSDANTLKIVNTCFPGYK